MWKLEGRTNSLKGTKIPYSIKNPYKRASTTNPGETEGEKETNYSYCKTCKKTYAGEIPYCPICKGIQFAAIEKAKPYKKTQEINK
jgi:uncharacterized protein (UPF0305 family)